VLGPGMRAVTVGVDAVSGLSGLVWPGDRVDLFLTQMHDRADVPVARRVSGETVLPRQPARVATMPGRRSTAASVICSSIRSG